MFTRLREIVARLQTNALRFEVIQNAGVSLMVKISSMLVMLVLEFVLARVLSFEDFGTYTFVLVWVLTLTIIGTLGFNISSIRFVSEYVAVQALPVLKSFLRYGLLVTLFASSILTVVSISIVRALVVWSFVESDLASVFYVALPLIPFISLQLVQSGILRGGKFITLSLFFQNVVIYALLLIFILIGFYTRLIVIDVIAVFGLFYLSLGSTLIIQYVLIRKKFDLGMVEAAKPADGEAWLKTSFSMMLSSSFQELINRLDIIAIGIFISPAATGVYAIALRFSRLINIGLQITNESSAHLFKPLYSSGRRKELQKIVFTSAKITLISTIPLIIILLFFPTFILSLYGEAFLSGKSLLQILMIGQLVNVLSGPNGLLLNMTEYQDLLARIFTITFFVDVVLLVILLPLLGVMGAALATTGVIVLRNVVTTIYVWKRLKINPTVLSIQAWRTVI